MEWSKKPSHATGYCPFKVPVPSHQIRSASEWYSRVGLDEYMDCGWDTAS